MAYGVKWNWSHPFESVVEAYRRAQHWNSGNPPEVLYRFDAVSYAHSDEYGDYYSTGPVLELDCYLIHHYTPCGARLDDGTFVNFSRYKQKALPTVDKALTSYRARKAKAKRLHEARARRAGIEYDLAVPAAVL